MHLPPSTTLRAGPPGVSPARRAAAGLCGIVAVGASVGPFLWLVLLAASINPAPGSDGTEGRRPQGVQEWLLTLGMGTVIATLIAALVVGGVAGLLVAARGSGPSRRAILAGILAITGALLLLLLAGGVSSG